MAVLDVPESGDSQIVAGEFFVACFLLTNNEENRVAERSFNVVSFLRLIFEICRNRVLN